MAKKKRSAGKTISIIAIVGLSAIILSEFLGFNVVSGLRNIAPTVEDPSLEIPFVDDPIHIDLPPDEIEELPLETPDPRGTELPFDNPPDMNMTETSNDNATQQYQEEVNPDPVTIEIKTTTILTDSSGNVTESITNSQIPLLAFFVEDISNRDFSTGIIENQLQIITSDQAQINGNATISIVIGNQTIGDPIKLDVDVLTDENGIADINFISPTGLGSKVLTFQFKNQLDKFPTIGVTDVKYVLNLELQAGENRYVENDLVIYSVDIATDPNQIIIIDEQGGFQRVYPTDDRFTVGNGGEYSRWVGCTSSTGGRCTKTSIICNRSAIGTAGTLEIFDFENNKVFEHLLTTRTTNTNWSSRSACSGSGDSVLLQRNAEYTVMFTSQKAGLPSTTFTLQTPESQKNYSYSCYWKFDGTVTCTFPKTGEVVG